TGVLDRTSDLFLLMDRHLVGANRQFAQQFGVGRIDVGTDDDLEAAFGEIGIDRLLFGHGRAYRPRVPPPQLPLSPGAAPLPSPLCASCLAKRWPVRAACGGGT